MKRLFGLSLVGIFLLSLSASHFVLAHNEGGEGTGKVTVCHITRSFVRDNGSVSFFGHIHSISRSALRAHLAHGDLIVEGGEQGDCCSFCRTFPRGRSCGLD